MPQAVIFAFWMFLCLANCSGEELVLNPRYQSNITGAEYFSQRKYKEAAEVYLGALAEDPLSLPAYTGLANCYKFLNLPDKALEIYVLGIDTMMKSIKSDDPDLTDDVQILRFALAEEYFFRGSNDEALDQINKALELKVRNPGIYLKAGQLYYTLGLKSLAKEILEKALFEAKMHYSKNLVLISNIEMAIKTVEESLR